MSPIQETKVQETKVQETMTHQELEARVQTYIDTQANLDLVRFITCGSVDDGKSTLIGRMLYEAQLIFEDVGNLPSGVARTHVNIMYGPDVAWYGVGYVQPSFGRWTEHAQLIFEYIGILPSGVARTHVNIMCGPDVAW